MIIFCMVVLGSGCMTGRRQRVSPAQLVRSPVHSLAQINRAARAAPPASTYYDVMNGDILAAFDFTCKASSSSICHTSALYDRFALHIVPLFAKYLVDDLIVVKLHYYFV